MGQDKVSFFFRSLAEIRSTIRFRKYGVSFIVDITFSHLRVISLGQNNGAIFLIRYCFFHGDHHRGYTLSVNNKYTEGWWRIYVLGHHRFKLRRSDAYLRHQSRPSMVQIMGCRLFGVKPLSEPMPEYCELYHWEQPSAKMSWKYRPFCLGLSALTPNHHLHRCWHFINRILGNKISKWNRKEQNIKGGCTTIFLWYTIIKLDDIQQNQLLGISFIWDTYITHHYSIFLVCEIYLSFNKTVRLQ